ncbi:putative hydrolase of the HAD superfamily [Actinoplanes xinjiangensis]|uniref:Putative hydrolase of the HAD superfamily n=1 Tax=Actinoplanes xinjiangensis TaxID=512350 RepID=A0A316FU41_9ACTN|nr:putative hydrolase of the HAD superfamily [Actinoplanes xinjiangensis]GIF37873.1 hypothetical protein Axi01nite_21840 [Actinoplanes xinjiangensis]
MPLLLVDLDNTLIDRDAAFRTAVAAFLDEHGLPAADLDWVMTADAGGYASRAAVAASMIDRFGVAARSVRTLLDVGAADHVVLAAPTADALRRVRAAGWTCVIVTNGRTVQQEAKIRNTGLDRLVDGWVVSEAVGCKKPDPAIFRAAAADLAGAWMIGDSPHADIAGASALGLTSVWVSAGRPWTETGYHPTHTAADVVTALGLLSQPDRGQADGHRARHQQRDVEPDHLHLAPRDVHDDPADLNDREPGRGGERQHRRDPGERRQDHPGRSGEFQPADRPDEPHRGPVDPAHHRL